MVSRRFRLPLTGALLVFLLFVASFAHATVMKYVGLPELVEMSDVIVHGHVTAKNTFVDAKTGHLLTNVTVTPARVFHGPEKVSFTFQQWGGQTDEKRSGIPGDARFEDGEEVILFLRKADLEPGLFLTALGQSKFKIIRSEDGATAYRELHDISFLKDGDGPTQIEHLEDEKRNAVYLMKELEALVSAVKGSKK